MIFFEKKLMIKKEYPKTLFFYCIKLKNIKICFKFMKNNLNYRFKKMPHQSLDSNNLEINT